METKNRPKQTFTPKICQQHVVKEEGKPDWIKEPAYTGTVTIWRPNYEERLSLLSDGQGENEQWSFTRRVAKQLPSYFVEADIKRVSDGRHFKTLEDLQYDTDMNSVLTEVVMLLVGKFHLGEDKESPS